MRLDAMADDTLIDDAALAFDAVSFIPPYNEFTGEPQATAPPFVPSYEKANARPPEDAAPPIDVRHFKTRLCVYLASGSCPHGARCFYAYRPAAPGAAPAAQTAASTALYAAAPRSRHLVSPGPIVAPAPFTYQEWAAVPPGTQYVNRVSSDDNPAQDLRADPWTRHAALEAHRGGAPHGGPRRIEPHSPTSPFSGAYNRPVDGVPFFADGPPLGGRAVGAPDWSFNGEAATSP